MDRVLRELVTPDLGTAVPGYQVAFSYRPAWREAEVGGDFYNLFPLGEQRFGLVLGDVGGKGLEAAAMAARMQPVLMALSLRPGATPAGVLDEAHRFWTALTADRLATLFVAVLDAPRGELTCSSAGHEPPLLLRGERLVRLELGLPPLIPLPVAPYQDVRLSLDPGDLLFAYTDGLTEAGVKGGKGELGLEAVEGLLRRAVHQTPEALLRSACRTAGLQAEGRLHDDIVMLALRRSPAATDSSLTFRRCRECPGACDCGR